ncbi:PAS domain S-box protein [Azotosporobacter soli]|uniref:PAS domain-containing sensor histidine kinase n=1 Tax=Azotosporobacter soli TaxID=3055040 RepID=UPI0031FEB7AE
MKSAKILEEQLRFWQTLIDSIPSPIFYKDRDFRYRGCNRAFEIYTGRKRDELIGKTVAELFDITQAQIYHAKDLDLFTDGGEQRYEAALRYADGSLHEVAFYKSLYYNENKELEGLVGIILDITERKQAENRLRDINEKLEKIVEERTQHIQSINLQLQHEVDVAKKMANDLAKSEEKFHKAFDYCADAIGIVRRVDRRYLEVNETFLRIFGYEKKDVIGHSSSEFNLWMDNEDREISYKKLTRDGRVHDQEAVWVTISGERRVGLHSSEVIEMDGEECVLFVWHDISERKKVEEELQQTKQELERKVVERTWELSENIKRLTQAQEQIVLSEKMAGIGQLAAGVAHELNNPMGFVKSNFQTMDEYVGVLSQAFEKYKRLRMLSEQSGVEELQKMSCEVAAFEQEKSVGFILTDFEEICRDAKEGIARASEIITALRAFSRVDSDGKVDEYDLNEGVRTTLMIARNETKYVATVELKLMEVPAVLALGGQINQVILNIVVNAAQAIKSAEIKDGKICVTSEYDEKYVRCSISNNGPAIPEKIRARIFEPFFTTKPVGQGTGIGLSLSYDIIVNRHKGNLYFNSTEQNGTTFVIELPITSN